MVHSLLLSMFFLFETAHMLNPFTSTKWHEGSCSHLVCTVTALTQCRKEQEGETHDPLLHKQLLERLRKITRKLQSVLIHVASVPDGQTPMEKYENKNYFKITVLMQILHTESEFTSWAYRMASCTYGRAIWVTYILHAFLYHYAPAENGSKRWQILVSLNFRMSILPNSELLNFSMHTIFILDSTFHF